MIKSGNESFFVGPQISGNGHLELYECVPQRLDGLYVEVIGRLVEDEKVGPVTAEDGKGHARFLASGKTLDLKRGVKTVKIQTNHLRTV